jgi:putative ABC transport system permease protein
MILQVLQHLFQPWTWRMAWRDSRNSRGRLLVFSSSIVLGIAALVAIASFGKNLEQAIALQARSLVGADLVLNSRQPFNDDEKALFRSIGGERASEAAFSSMLHFPDNRGSRLVQVRAIEGNFPFYGTLETEPASAERDFRNGGALVEESLLLQFDAKVGDIVRIGDLTNRVVGALKKVPGETVVFATIAPRVFVSLAEVEKANLIRDGSLARYKEFFRLPDSTDVPALTKKLRPDFERLQLSADTVERSQERLGRTMENMTNFLSLVGFVALLLGGVGVASAIHTHVKQKLPVAAVLRCLGATNARTYAVYLAQAVALGAIGASAGALLGILVQLGLPRVLGDFLPMQIDFSVAWGAVAESMFAGFALCVLFALWPLLDLRRVSPLAAIRSAVQPTTGQDPAKWLAALLLLAGIGAFLVRHTERKAHAVGFAVALVVAFAVLVVAASVLMWITRRWLAPALPYLWRQGVANLHRPGNRTLLLMVSVGLGTFLITTMLLVQQTLLKQIGRDTGASAANTVLFDIQPDERDGVAAILKQQKLPILDEAAVITMRLASIKGVNVEDTAAVRSNNIPRWLARREFRSTYRDTLTDGEKIVAGTWPAKKEPGTPSVPVSLESGVAKDMRVGLGDIIVWDVQGIPIETKVAALREVDWRRVQPNFFAVFPPSTLKGAPGFNIITTRVDSPEQSAALQRAVSRDYPTVSSIDATLIVKTLDAILDKVAFVIRFMAAFTVATGLLVLAGAILTGRFQRIQESVLLRTLGATRPQVRLILLVEYAGLGVLAALTGVLLAMGGAWLLSQFVFHTPFRPTVWPIAAMIVGVSSLTVAIGWLGSRGVLSAPPLEVLRAET